MKRGTKKIKIEMIKKLSLLFVSVFGISFLSSFAVVKKNISSINENNLNRVIEDSSLILQERINSKILMATAIAGDSAVSDMSIPVEEKQDKLLKYVEELNLRSLAIVDADGNMVSTDGFTTNISQRDYFKNGMQKKETYVSDPSFVKDTDEQIIFISVPLINGNDAVGVMTCTFDSSFLSEQIKNLKYFNQGTSYVLSNTGQVIASENIEDVRNKKSIIEESENDSSLLPLADIHKRMISGESKVEENKDNYIAYTTINGTEGWSIALEVDKSFVDKGFRTVAKVFIVISLLGIIVLTIIIYISGDRLGRRMTILKNGILPLAEGRFDLELDEKELNKDDEIGDIYRAVDETKASIRNVIIGVKADTDILNNQSSILKESAGEITSGAANISTAMHECAEANTTQSSELLKISEDMKIFGDNIDIIDNNIVDLMKVSSNIESTVNVSNDNMLDLGAGVESFGESFKNFNHEIVKMNDKISSIKNITSVINGIAEQTTLLALNAAIEAARAGEAGKGFSVVADEISKLAEQSKDSANEIGNIVNGVVEECSELISSTDGLNLKVSDQRQSIDGTIEAFKNVTMLLNEIAPKIKEISTLSSDNNTRKDYILQAIESVTAISEEFAASTEEVDATAEEFNIKSQDISLVSEKLSEIMDMLNAEMDKFII